MATDQRITQLETHLVDWEKSRKRRLGIAALLPIIAAGGAGYWAMDRFQSIDQGLSNALDAVGASSSGPSIDDKISGLASLEGELDQLRTLPETLDAERARLAAVESERTALQAQFDDLQAARAQVRKSIEGLESDIASLRSERDAVSRERSSLADELTNLSIERDQIMAESRAMANRLGALEQEFANALDELKRNQAALSEGEAALDAARQDGAALKSERTLLLRQIEELKGEISILNKTMHELGDRVDQSWRARVELERLLEEQSVQTEAVIDELTTAEGQARILIGELTEKLRISEAARFDTGGSIAEQTDLLNDIAGLNTEIASLTQSLRKKTEQASSSERAQAELHQLLSEQTAQTEAVSARLTARDAQAQALIGALTEKLRVKETALFEAEGEAAALTTIGAGSQAQQARGQRLAALEADLENARLGIGGLLSQIKDLENQRIGLGAANQALIAEQGERDARMQAVQAADRAAIGELERALGALEVQLDVQRLALDNKSTAYEALEREVIAEGEKRAAAEQLSAGRDADFFAIQAKLSHLDGELASVRADNEALKANDQLLASSNETLKAELKNVSSQLEDVSLEQAGIEQAQAEKVLLLEQERDAFRSTLAGENTELAAQNNELLQLIATNEADAVAADREIFDLRVAMKDLEASSGSEASLVREQADYIKKMEARTEEILAERKALEVRLNTQEQTAAEELGRVSGELRERRERSQEEALLFAAELSRVKTQAEQDRQELGVFREREARLEAGLIRLKASSIDDENLAKTIDSQAGQLGELRFVVAQRDARIGALEAEISDLSDAVRQARADRVLSIADTDPSISRIRTQLAANALEASVLSGTAVEGAKIEIAELLASVKGNIPGGDNVSILDGGRIVMSSGVLFESGETEVNGAGRTELATIALRLKDALDGLPDNVPWMIRVDGHTDSQPVRRGPYPSNWEISGARASSVARTLIEWGIPKDRIIAAGFADTQPVVGDDTEQAWRQNRRIELSMTVR